MKVNVSFQSTFLWVDQVFDDIVNIGIRVSLTFQYWLLDNEIKSLIGMNIHDSLIEIWRYVTWLEENSDHKPSIWYRYMRSSLYID